MCGLSDGKHPKTLVFDYCVDKCHEMRGPIFSGQRMAPQERGSRMTARINLAVLGAFLLVGCELGLQADDANQGNGGSSTILEGPAGPRGATGAAGPAGISGERGAEGASGSPGSAGAQGTSGAGGPSGPPGQVGPAGVQGPVGLCGPAGSQGAVGPAGITGAPGATGPRGSTGPAAKSICTWCHPGETSCSADQKRVRRCVDDGDGCGHWEEGEVCEYRCDDEAQDKVDALGNRTYAYSAQCIRTDACSYVRSCASGHTCVEGQCRLGNPNPDEPGSNCGNSIPCAAGERCEWDVCVASDHWLVATAILNAPDGLVHHFSALDAYGSALDGSYAWCQTTPASYWKKTSNYCGIAITTAGWTQSDQGPEFAGNVVSDVSLRTSVYGVGTYYLSSWDCPRIVTDKFVTHNQTCSLKVTEFVTGADGYAAGTFEGTALVDEVSGQTGGTLELQGAFRVRLL